MNPLHPACVQPGVRDQLFQLLVLPALLLCLEVRSQARYEFGFSLNPTAQGALHGLFIYTVLDGQAVGSVPMRALPFFLQASGMEESRANLEMIDLFAEHGIAGCGPLASSSGATSDLDCLPLKDLWKLRYQDGMGVASGMGWAAEPMRPSERQQIILQHYRPPQYDHWHGPYFGNDAFRLLRDMQDPAWVETYRRGG